MTKIAEKFSELKRSGRKGFIPYITAGDPSLLHTQALLPALIRAGSDLIEIGVPFSDPLADGPVIQRASQRALASGTTLAKILERVAEFKKSAPGEHPQVPFVLFSYLNPIWQMGIEPFARRARAAGIGGVLLTDLTPEEAPPIQEVFEAQDLDLIFLIAPTSTDERIKKICAVARGFIYAVSRTGTTGTRDSLAEGVGDFVARIRRHTPLPIAVGFGISTRPQVEAVWEHAEAAVVGSAIVREIEIEMERVPPLSLAADSLATKIEMFVRALRAEA